MKEIAKTGKILIAAMLFFSGFLSSGCKPKYYKSKFGNYLPLKPNYQLCEAEKNNDTSKVIDYARIYQSTTIQYNTEVSKIDTVYSYIRFFQDGTCFSKWQIGKPSIREYEQTRNGFPGCWRIINNKLYTEHYNHHFAGTYFLSEYHCSGDTLRKTKVKSGKYGTWTKSDLTWIKSYVIQLESNKLEEKSDWNSKIRD